MTTLSDAVDQYLALRQAKVDASTARGEAGEIRRFLAFIGNVNTTAVRHTQVNDYFYGDTGRHHELAPASFNNVRARIKGFCQWMQDERMVNTNLLRQVDRRRQPVRERLRLDNEQMQHAIDSARHPRDRVMVALAINTGLRISSIVDLTVGDVDLKTGTLTYRNVKCDRERSMPITADLDRELRTWLTKYAEICGPLLPSWYLTPARPRGGWNLEVLPDRQANRPRRVISEALSSLDLGGKSIKYEGYHTFRRSAGRAVFESAMADGDPRAIHIAQAFLDHEDARTTQVYIGTSHERVALDKLLKGREFLRVPQETGENVVHVQFGRKRNA